MKQKRLIQIAQCLLSPINLWRGGRNLIEGQTRGAHAFSAAIRLEYTPRAKLELSFAWPGSFQRLLGVVKWAYHAPKSADKALKAFSNRSGSLPLITILEP
jgi:hypothetical protein